MVDTALNQPQASIPVLVRLGKWTDAGQTLHDFIAHELGDLGAYLDTLRRALWLGLPFISRIRLLR